MKPRLILKTHSGVRRPGIFSVLVARCSSPTQPTDEETITRRLAAAFQNLSRDELKGATLGERGAAFHAVWMARPQQLGLLTSNLFWAWRGHVVRILTPCDAEADARAYLPLSRPEQIIYLKYYLEGDGAILIALARELIARGSLSEKELVHSDLLERVLKAIWDQYLNLSTNITERVELRHRIQRENYDPTTRRHKTYPHLVPLEDMGLLARHEADDGDTFTAVVNDNRTPLQSLVEGFPTISDLETAITQGDHTTVIAEVMCKRYRQFSDQDDRHILMRTSLENYRKLRASGAPIYPLDAITDATYAQMLADRAVLVNRRHIDKLFRDLQAKHPQQVRFHVDRFGLPAYVIVADDLVARILSP